MNESQRKKTLERLADRMERVGDELRVRAHLAGMEAKDAWDRAHLERITDELRGAAEEARLQIHLASLDARKAWSRVDDKIGELSGRFGTTADEIVRELSRGLSDVTRALREGGAPRERDERR